MEQMTRVTVLLILGTGSLAKTTQPFSMDSYEGQEVNLSCTHPDIATSDNIVWYRQVHHQGPQFVIRGYKTDVANEVASLFIPNDRKSSTLSLPRVALRDTAVYYCIANFNRLHFGSGTKLIVKPIIENPEPAVYQLRDPKSRNTSVCLFTDFDSNVNLSESVLPGVPHTQPTVLNMKSLDSKSNAAVAWSSKSNFDCRNTFGDPTFYPSSDYPCNATLVEESFETDMNLNLENLSVMALRILLLKVAGFNLLMTLRLWSS